MNVSECRSRNVMQCQLFSHHRACRAPGSFVRSIPIWQQGVGQQDVARRCLAARLCAEVIHFRHGEGKCLPSHILSMLEY